MSNNNRWNQEVSGFEPRPEQQGTSAPAPLVRRSPSIVPQSDAVYKQAIATKLHNMVDKIKHVREHYSRLKEEADGLQADCRTTRKRILLILYDLADKTRKLDQAVLEAEAKVAPLINEKKRLYNELLTSKGNIKVFCRTRPLSRDEGPSVVEFSDDFTIRVNTGDDTVSSQKKDYEFDRVYGPHIGQAEVFTDVQPFVQSALDGHNVSIFAYGQTGSGKTHTMEGSSHDRGLYARCFEELFDVSNSDKTLTSRFNFFVTIVELHNEQMHDLISESKSGQHLTKVNNPLDFSNLIKKALSSRSGDKTKINISHLIITIHIYYDNLITGENIYSKLSLVDLAGSESLGLEDNIGEQTPDMLHVMKSLSALGDVLASLTANKEDVPYENYMLTNILADSMGGSSKTLLIVNICPNVSNLFETLSSLNFSARARNTTLNLGNRDTIKKWKDIASDARKRYYEKEKENDDLKQEVAGLKQALKVNAALLTSGNKSKISSVSTEGMESAAATKKLEEELPKRDALIEALGALPKHLNQSPDLGRHESNNKDGVMDVVPFSSEKKADGTLALVNPVQDKIKSTPTGEYLTSALNDFDLEKYDGLAAISDRANKLLMLVLSAVTKAGASGEHEILAEVKDAVFSFIRKLEPQRVMDTMLVSRVRILYIRSLLARLPELQSIKVLAVDRFLEKPSIGHSRSPGRSPGRYDPTTKNALIVDGQMQGFKVNIKPKKKSKLPSVFPKIRGIDQKSWRQHVTVDKLREITEDAKAFATGNKALAALFVHTPAGELQRQIRSWLAMNFDFLLVTGVDAVGGATGQLELYSTAIMDGWMAGLGAAMPPLTDALGQLLVEYEKWVYYSQLQHLKDIAGTLATEAAEGSSQVAKLCSALESVDHKRSEILQQMKGDSALLTLEDGGSPIRNPSSAAEDVRLPSLIALDNILKQIKEIMRQSSVNIMSRSKKKALVTALDDLSAQLASLLEIDRPCAQRYIGDARRVVESIVEEDDKFQGTSRAASDDLLSAETDVAQGNMLQFNAGSTTPFTIKCGANSHSELVGN